MRPVLLLIIIIAAVFKPCAGQGLEFSIRGNQLEVSNSEDLHLSYLPADQFQKLDWEPGFAYYPDGNSRQFDGMKYNPEMDGVQVSIGGSTITLLPGAINGVSMEKEKIVTRIFVKVPLKEAVFMELLSPGKIHLLMYRKVKKEKMDMYQETDATNLIFDKKEEPPVEFDEILYIWNIDRVETLKNSKKSILSLMGDHKDEIERYLDDNNIRLKNITDLKGLFDYYNGLD